MIKGIKLLPGSKMFFYDAETLFSLVPITNCIEIIKGKLKTNLNIPKQNKLTPDEIGDLILICLESLDFIFADRHHSTNDSRPIGLSLMVTVSQVLMIHILETAVQKPPKRKSFSFSILWSTWMTAGAASRLNHPGSQVFAATSIMLTLQRPSTTASMKSTTV
jgi:hypothetical protein